MDGPKRRLKDDKRRPQETSDSNKDENESEEEEEEEEETRGEMKPMHGQHIELWHGQGDGSDVADIVMGISLKK